jgi:hypothetical protein
MSLRNSGRAGIDGAGRRQGRKITLLPTTNADGMAGRGNEGDVAEALGGASRNKLGKMRTFAEG